MGGRTSSSQDRLVRFGHHGRGPLITERRLSRAGTPMAVRRARPARTGSCAEATRAELGGYVPSAGSSSRQAMSCDCVATARGALAAGFASRPQ